MNRCSAPLNGHRKVVVGNHDWRLVWRPTTDARGSLVVDIAEVWAVGARSDSDVYDEMTRRVATLADVAGCSLVANSSAAVATGLVDSTKEAAVRVAHPDQRRVSAPEGEAVREREEPVVVLVREVAGRQGLEVDVAEWN